MLLAILLVESVLLIGDVRKEEMHRHVRDWQTAYNFAKQLKVLKLKTPYVAIQELWKSKPEAFIVKPHYHMPGPKQIVESVFPE